MYVHAPVIKESFLLSFTMFRNEKYVNKKVIKLFLLKMVQFVGMYVSVCTT